MSFERNSGLLLHPTSFPGKFGIGTLGKEAYKFVDFLIEAGQKLWQVYPLGPTGYGDSPYQCFSAFAGNPLLIDLEKLKEEGLLTKEDLETKEEFDEDKIDYGKVINFKFPILKIAFETFTKKASGVKKQKFDNFCISNNEWLDDFSLFMALKENFNGKPWVDWDYDIKVRTENSLNKYKYELADKVLFQKFIQYLFFKQWSELKAYANQNYIKIIGDIPIFVAFDSSDAWSNSNLFQFDEDKKPVQVAGVPPDYFSKTGQLWGNPLYNWDALKDQNYKWWIDRIKANLEVADIIRIDHFRGFAAYWAVPANEKTAINGTWIPAPGKDLFEAIEKELGILPIIAEDLGVITPDVEELRDHFNFPGMKILQFAFDSEEDSDYLPHNFPKNSVVYTGTHDNDTIVGWYNNAKDKDKDHVKEYFHVKSLGDKNVSWEFIRAAWSSTSIISIAPLQDLLCLGGESRMNTPGLASGNWMWRYPKKSLSSKLAKKLYTLTKNYYRI